MFKKFLIAISGVIVVVLTLGAVKVAQIKAMSSVTHVPPPTAVTTAEALAENWHSYLNSIGTLAPVDGVTISADADGTVTRLAVDSGAAVKTGDLLVELDTSIEVAQLGAAQARADLARVNIERAKDLWERNVSSKSEYDLADATYKQTLAEVAAIKALIAKSSVRYPNVIRTT